MAAPLDSTVGQPGRVLAALSEDAAGVPEPGRQAYDERRRSALEENRHISLRNRRNAAE
jgi:hypothetical protein